VIWTIALVQLDCAIGDTKANLLCNCRTRCRQI
jgi:hypothetical protein